MISLQPTWTRRSTSTTSRTQTTRLAWKTLGTWLNLMTWLLALLWDPHVGGWDLDDRTSNEEEDTVGEVEDSDEDLDE